MRTPDTHLSGTILGYDPGGNNGHGLASLVVRNGMVLDVQTRTLATSEEVTRFAVERRNVVGLGADTLTCWSTGQSGWRPAERWLREQYPSLRRAITSPNALNGSMLVNGMAVLLTLRDRLPSLAVCEAHPRLLYWSLVGEPYDYRNARPKMDQVLGNLLSVPMTTANGHEWDAAMAAYATLQGLTGQWSTDLHTLPAQGGERLIRPCGDTAYFWPD